MNCTKHCASIALLWGWLPHVIRMWIKLFQFVHVSAQKIKICCLYQFWEVKYNTFKRGPIIPAPYWRQTDSKSALICLYIVCPSLCFCSKSQQVNTRGVEHEQPVYNNSNSVLKFPSTDTQNVICVLLEAQPTAPLLKRCPKGNIWCMCRSTTVQEVSQNVNYRPFLWIITSEPCRKKCLVDYKIVAEERDCLSHSRTAAGQHCRHWWFLYWINGLLSLSLFWFYSVNTFYFIFGV